MRGIKFRVWVDGFDTPFHAPQNDWSLSLHDTGHMLLMWCSDGIVDELPVSRIEQFTGLQDNNGNDIYEGDILSLGKDLEAFNCVVGFDEYQGSFRCRSVNESEYYSEHLYGADTCEVIGNIHQNPELLESNS